MTDTPQVLLAHHLKTLKLPTWCCHGNWLVSAAGGE